MFLAAMDIEEVMLAWVLKFWLVLVLINVPMLSGQSVCLPKLSG